VGQTRRVLVLRYIARHTVEERLLELQQAKQQLADGALSGGGGGGGAQKLRMEDLMSFFK
jgi:SNF2 family DNA or RNA helicase